MQQIEKQSQEIFDNMQHYKILLENKVTLINWQFTTNHKQPDSLISITVDIPDFGF